MLRSALAAALVLLVGLLLVGLTFSASSRQRADFSFVNNTEPKTLDPTTMTGEPEGRIAQALFEGLMRLDPKSLTPVPGAAESYDVSDDGRRYVFHMRPNARWSDGRPVTAHDFAYAWRRIEDPKLGSEYAYILHVVSGAEEFNTFVAQGVALQGEVPKRLRELQKTHPGAIPARQFREFVEKNQLFLRTKGSPDAWLGERLGKLKEELAEADVATFESALKREGARRQRAGEEATKHFGIDRGVYPSDANTLVVELRAPTPYFLELCAFHSSYPVPRWVVEAKGNAEDWFLPHKIVSNGPYRMLEWQVGDHIRMVRSETYWGKNEVRLRTIDALPVENQMASLNLYLSGAVDWLPSNSYPTDLSDYLRSRPDFYRGPALIFYFYRINCDKKPFNDVRVRRALNLAVDRKQLTEQVLSMGQPPAYSLVPPGLHDYRPPRQLLKFDVAEARRLLSEAGFPDGRGFPAFGILYNTQEAHKKIAEAIADQLTRNLGLKVSAYNQEWQAYLHSTHSQNYDVARAGWVGDYEDPNTFLDLWITNGGNNSTGFSDPLYDRLLAAAAQVDSFIASPSDLLAALPNPEDLRSALAALERAADAKARLRESAHVRLELLRAAEDHLLSDGLPIIPLYFYVLSGMVRPHVKGFYTRLVGSDGQERPNPRDIHPFRDIWVDERR
ncbi:MAG: peptide ABC transporter substrate-binding protein [Polyangiaceae bacterium]